MARGRVPIVGNVKPHILGERMVKSSLHASPASSNGNAEKRIVRWKTCGKDRGDKSAVSGGGGGVTSGSRSTDDSEFCGLFIFEFDELGRAVHHTIEHADEGENWDRNTAEVISVTEWLLGKARGANGANYTMGCSRLPKRWRSPKDQRFQTLIAPMLSPQTRDTATAAVMHTLQTTPLLQPAGLTLSSLLTLAPEDLISLIRPVGFHTTKAHNILAVCHILTTQYDSDIPSTISDLMSLRGSNGRGRRRRPRLV
ncbi:MAG: hypothetical protein M1839_005926 [Geoglossum umbratile]|nr:MAG: hypothetical protein M1839_005926 [Geoglossum umbratile]